jgi:nitronate monooxygenase
VTQTLPRLVQAPMANNQPAALAAAVSNAGALGSIPGAALAATALREAIREVRTLTDAPFGVNLFAPPHLDEDSLAVVLEERPSFFSFTFGIVDPAPFREAGITVLGTATTVAEAEALRTAGVDAVVAQGAEAGGHRGTFLGPFEDGLVPLAELVPAISGVPVIAAGGIVDAPGVRAALDLGAAGVQVGTAFLFTPECARPREHLEALRTYDTVVTDAYTGRPMRAARTPVLEQLMNAGPPLPYPQQRAVSAQLGPLYMGGTGARRARERTVAELVAELTV